MNPDLSVLEGWARGGRLMELRASEEGWTVVLTDPARALSARSQTPLVFVKTGAVLAPLLAEAARIVTNAPDTDNDESEISKARAKLARTFEAQDGFMPDTGRAARVVLRELERLAEFRRAALEFSFNVQTALGDKHNTPDGMLDEILRLAREERNRQEGRKKITIHYRCRACKTTLLDIAAEDIYDTTHRLRRRAGWHERDGKWFCPACPARTGDGYRSGLGVRVFGTTCGDEILSPDIAWEYIGHVADHIDNGLRAVSHRHHDA